MHFSLVAGGEHVYGREYGWTYTVAGDIGQPSLSADVEGIAGIGNIIFFQCRRVKDGRLRESRRRVAPIEQLIQLTVGSESGRAGGVARLGEDGVQGTDIEVVDAIRHGVREQQIPSIR